MRQYSIKILTCIIVLIYVVGLSKHLVINSLHMVHHYFAHTQHQHSHFEQNQLSKHGHSHNSFVDFTLFEEEKNQSHPGESEASLPTTKNLNFHSHLLGCCSLVDVDVQLLEIIHEYNFVVPKEPIITPIHPPPRICFL